jgi:hypothetical protein
LLSQNGAYNQTRALEFQYSSENGSFRRKFGSAPENFSNFRIFAGCLPEFAL